MTDLARRSRPHLRASLLLFILASCSGSGSSPTAPDVTQPTKMLSTQWGNIAVSAGSCAAVDFDRLVDSVEQGYDRARQVVGSSIDSVRLEGLMVSGEENLACAGTPASGCYFFDQDLIRFRCGSENVMNHELQHRFCDRLRRPCDCYRVDHAGGFDLNCSPA